MRTDDLIAGLAESPWPRERPPMRLAAALLTGWAIALVGLVVALGPPFAAVRETGLLPFAVKFGFTLTFTVFSVLASIAAGRPGKRIAFRLSLIAAPFLVLAILAALEISSTPRDAWGELFFGTTFITCLTAIVLGSIPVLVAGFWAYREMAPTRPAVAGLLVGLSAGAAAAFAYALYCPETTACFLLAAYTPGALLAAFAGMAAGPKLLRW
jgi:hypothetical protein